MQKDHIIVGVHVTDRVKHAGEVQGVLTTYGCDIKTRLGLHEVGPEASCSPNGLLLIEFVGSKARCNGFCRKLNAVEGVDAKAMSFGHD